MDGESKFSILERYGENYTEKEYITNPAIGRDQQIKELLLILLTPEKSAILVGKPGIGKTAIVEGLAYAIQRKEVPDALVGYTIINIKTASLLGTMPNGESKVQVMIDELKDKEKIILFVDEIHMLIGATDESSLDFANIFKEGLGRGSIKVVGATTTEEYERYILRDKAFTRRFQKVNVPEPTRDETVKIMMGTLPKLEKTTGVKLKYTNFQQELIMGFLVDITSEYKRVFEVGSRYPDISLTLLKSAFSFTVFDNRKEVTIHDFEKAILNTHLVYEDVVKKELPFFKEKFKDMYDEEAGILKEGIVIKQTDYSSPLEKPTSDLNSYQESDNPETYRSDISGTRDERVMPEKEDTSALDLSLLNGVVLTPESLKPQPKEEVKVEEKQIIETPKEEFEGVYYNNIPNEKPFFTSDRTNIRQEVRDVPRREDFKALDDVLTSKNTSNDTNFNLELDDNDDLDDKDDFFDE